MRYLIGFYGIYVVFDVIYGGELIVSIILILLKLDYLYMLLSFVEVEVDFLLNLELKFVGNVLVNVNMREKFN